MDSGEPHAVTVRLDTRLDARPDARIRPAVALPPNRAAGVAAALGSSLATNPGHS